MKRLVLFLLLVTMAPFVGVVAFLGWVARLLDEAEIEE